MPTGYTSSVGDGTVSDFATFALRCARNFGALIMMRDEPMDAPIPERFEPSQFYEQRLREDKARLVRLEAMTPNEVEKARDASYLEAMEQWQRREFERTKMRNRYQAMLAEVVQWEPPTLEHRELKDFMLQQLHESIRFDCSGDYDTRPEMPSVDVWWREQKATAARDVQRNAEEHAKEIQRTDSRNRWLAALRDSLAKTATTS